MKASTEIKIKDSGLLRATSLVSAMTLISRILGLVRDMVVGFCFGAVAGMDAYYVAAKIPNFLRRIFAEGSFQQAFVPVLSDYQQSHDHQALAQFIRHLSGLLAACLLIITTMAMVLAPWVIRLFAPGFDGAGERFTEATVMLRITFPYIFFISLTAFLSSVLNCFGRFAIPALTPVFLNICLIIAAVWWAPHLAKPIHALAWGMTIAGMVQFGFQMPFVARIKLLIMPRPSWQDPGVIRVLKLMVPTLIAASVSQINLLLDTVFASFLTIGSVSWLYYSDRLTQFPLGVFGVAISTVILPYLSRRHAEENHQGYCRTMDWGVQAVLLIGVPAAIGLFLLASPLLTTLFQYGRFTAHDVAMAALSLRAFAVGLTAFMLVKILASGFFARKNTKTPVKIALIVMATNAGLSGLLIWPLAHAGLALATSLAAWLHVALLLWYLRRAGIYETHGAWFKFFFQLVVANGLMILGMWFFQNDLSQWVLWDWHARLWHLLFIILLSMTTYLLSLRMVGIRVRSLLGKKN